MEKKTSPAHTFPRGPFSHRQPSSFSPALSPAASPCSGPKARARAQRTSPLRVARLATDRPGPLISGLPSTFLLQPRDGRIPLLAGPAAPELACPRATPPPQGPLASPSERPSLLEASPTRAGSSQNRCRDCRRGYLVHARPGCRAAFNWPREPSLRRTRPLLAA